MQITILFSIFIVNINPPRFQIHLTTVDLFESENKKRDFSHNQINQQNKANN